MNDSRHMTAPTQIDGGTPESASIGVTIKLTDDPRREKHSTIENASDRYGPSNHRAVYAFWSGTKEGGGERSGYPSECPLGHM